MSFGVKAEFINVCW